SSRAAPAAPGSGSRSPTTGRRSTAARCTSKARSAPARACASRCRCAATTLPSEASDERPREERAMSDRARVLVADDEVSIRFVVRETLESAGHEVVEASSGEAALQALQTQPFDIAFFDIRMPGPSGLELLDQMRTLP